MLTTTIAANGTARAMTAITATAVIQI